MTGPGDERPGAGCGRLRASHADREQVIEVLKAAFVHGQLSKDEFDLRVGRAFTARILAELAAVTADIPAGVAVAQPPRAPARKSADRARAIGWGACVIIPLAALGAVSAWPTTNAVLFVLSVFALIGATAVAWAAMVETRAQKRARGQRPQGPVPGAGGQASWRTTVAVESEQLPQIYPAPPHAAEAAPRLHPRPQVSGPRTPHLWRPDGRRFAVG
jgi:Domain of unknown function (DUF1707)